MIVSLAIVRDRLRVVAMAVLPIAGTLIPLHRLLDVFKGADGTICIRPRLGRRHGGSDRCARWSSCSEPLIGWAERLREPRPMG